MDSYDQERYVQKKEEPLPAPVYDEVGLGMEILKVKSKTSDDLPSRLEVVFLDDEGKERTGWVKNLPKYKEMMSTDMTTANVDNIDRAICIAEQNIANSIKYFGKKYGMDLSGIYNSYVDLHNYRMVSSKSSGFGAKAARSHFIHQKVDRKSMINEESYTKNSGLAGLFGR